MRDRLLSKDKAAEFVQGLMRDRDVFAPVERAGGPAFERLDLARGAGVVVWDFGNTDMSPKDIFFPQTECLMRFDNHSQDEEHPEGMVMKPERGLKRPRVVLNMRPCDARAFFLLDRIYMRDELTNDVYWRDKRENTVVFGLACEAPRATCFCTSMGSGPHHEEGLDALLVDLGDRYLVRPFTERGEALLGDLPEAGDKDARQAAKRRKAAEALLAESEPVPMDGIDGSEVLDLYEHPLWDRLHETCLNCGACTFTCPTCHCFDIQDETDRQAGRRLRNWDTCMSKLFTLHASGHNPRGEAKSRVRQRFMHKFKYIPMKQDGLVGCVGCGRCVRLCPVNIDVREVVRDMNKKEVTA